jgi:Peroxiredoxin
MRKLLFLFAVIALVLASCTTNSYKITGTVQGAYDGEKVFIKEQVKNDFIDVDSAVITNGKFEFEGVQDQPVHRFITFFDGENDPLFVDLFLENGNIDVFLAEEQGKSTAKGSPVNDAYQVYKDDMGKMDVKLAAIYESLRDTALTDEVKEAKLEELEAIEEEATGKIKKYIADNSNTPLATLIMITNQSCLSYEEMDELLKKIPANLQEGESVMRLKSGIENYSKTNPDKKFTDIELNTPDGDPIKLSDYAGKGKVVLVDFWASWCGPCVREMPALVEMYAKYKDKGLEIVGISLDRNGDAWKKGIQNLNITWPQMSDLGYWDSKAAKMYAIRSIPHVMIIDKDGTIVSRGLHGEELYAKIDEMMK